MSYKLDIKVVSGVSAGDVFHFNLEDGQEIIIGRAIDCNLVLQDATISRKHISIFSKNNSLRIMDLGSTHGTLHMGFNLEAGEEKSRQLNNGDEFKIGELLFAVNFSSPDSEGEKVQGRKEVSSKNTNANNEKLLKIFKKNKLLIGIGLFGVLVLLLLPGEDKPAIPAQKSNEIILLPNYGAVGYYTSPYQQENDLTHLDKAQFELPASNSLIEFSYTSETNISVKIDEVEAEKFPPTTSWKKREILVRGIGSGEKRKLIFDNLEYPNANPNSAEQKKWAVKDVRALPLGSKNAEEGGFAKEIDIVIANVDGVDKNPEGLFNLLRSLQIALMSLLDEVKLDSVGIEVNTDISPVLIDFTNISSLRQRLELLKSNYQSASVSYDNLLTDLSKIVSETDAELWRRLNSRVTQAKLSAKVKNYIEAHDNLLSALKMFPEEADYRWTIANKLFQNNDVVPKKCRDNPERYRKGK